MVGCVYDPLNVPLLMDTYSTDNVQPLPDARLGGQNSVTAITGFSQQSGVTMMSFKRKLDTGDANDFDITDTQMYLQWAHCGADILPNG
ncbi:DOMON domain-containing protein, partial [Vibrio cholerae]|uniref:DOMON domain-containing protein n=1 Tax=Vibrio cholerae TaxID=666 RepID=UPI0034DB2565